MDKLFGDDIRGIIGSFHPSRPILTNEEIYSKILEINPEFSIIRLLERYEKWYNNKIEGGELYKQLTKLRFSASGSIYNGGEHEYIQISSIDDIDKLSKLLGISVQYGSSTIYVRQSSIKDELKEALIQYIKNDLCNPSVTKPFYNDGYMLQYSHIQEESGEGMVDNIDEYVNKIKEYDSQFGLSKVYYKLSNQYKLAKKLDEKYIAMITSILPKLSIIQYISHGVNGIYFYDKIGEGLIGIDDANYDLFQSIIANLYHGINSAEIELGNIHGIIEVDTYPSGVDY